MFVSALLEKTIHLINFKAPILRQIYFPNVYWQQYVSLACQSRYNSVIPNHFLRKLTPATVCVQTYRHHGERAELKLTVRVKKNGSPAPHAP